MNRRNIIIINLAFIIYTAGFLIANYLSELDKITFKSYQDTLFLSISRINTFSILLENLKVIAILILGGFIFGIPTFLNIFSNGYMFGVIFAVYSKTFKIDQFLLLVLPHGVFEIPAIVIAGAAGFKIPYEIVRYLAGKKEQPLTKEDIKEYLTLALISIILIVIAAWIEANVTLKIAQAMLNSTKGI
jgi:uncharacterized membrane protein SpoIIM required for sporulation